MNVLCALELTVFCYSSICCLLSCYRFSHIWQFTQYPFATSKFWLLEVWTGDTGFTDKGFTRLKSRCYSGWGLIWSLWERYSWKFIQVIGGVQLFVTVGLRSHFLAGCQPGSALLLLQVTCTPSQVSSFIFKTSNNPAHKQRKYKHVQAGCWCRFCQKLSGSLFDIFLMNDPAARVSAGLRELEKGK